MRSVEWEVKIFEGWPCTETKEASPDKGIIIYIDKNADTIPKNRIYFCKVVSQFSMDDFGIYISMSEKLHCRYKRVIAKWQPAAMYMGQKPPGMELLTAIKLKFFQIPLTNFYFSL